MTDDEMTSERLPVDSSPDLTDHDKVAEEHAEPSDLPTEVDWLLRALVTSANAAIKFELPITLYVGGLIVSGLLVGGERYFDAIADEIAAGTIPTDEAPSDSAVETPSFPEILRGYGKGYESATGQEIDAWPEFIHVLDAQAFSPSGPIPTTRGVPWRGLLRRVDAFSYGRLETATGK